MDSGHVKSNLLQSGIMEIEFFHPKHNALPGELLTQLTEAIHDAGNDPSVQLIILKSAGNRTFCAGASFDELVAIADFETGKQFFMGFANVINACRKCPKLIIGQIQGKAVGGGVGLASAVDYCLATQYASVKLSELNIGIGPFVVGPAVERKIGLSAFSQMTINANSFYPASWAERNGLFAEIFEDNEDLREGTMRLAKYLCSTNPEARNELKKVFWQGCEDWDDLLAARAQKSGRLVLSAFTKRALDKYKN